MPLTFGKLNRQQRTSTIEFLGEQVTFTYNPGEITPALGQDMMMSESPLVLMLSKALISWDVVDDSEEWADGQVHYLPTDENTLAGLGTEFLTALKDKIQSDMSGNVKKS